MKKIIRLAFIFLSVLCTSCSKLNAHSISVVNWNVQTFFDAVTEGNEYSDFKNNSNWNKDAYQTRLKRLTDSINSMNADIFVFEELENDGVLYDITNQLSGNIWDEHKIWPFGCFRKNQDESIGCGIISRFPINYTKIHKLDIRSEAQEQPSMRPIMEISLNINNCELLLLVNHWKSKSGGEEESEVWRNWQETVLSNLFVEHKGKKILASGDFNRDISEFQSIKLTSIELENANNLYLRNFFTEEKCAVFSPWIRGTGTLVSPGSYYYQNKWERIDHFFASEELKVTNFYPVTDGSWCSSDTQKPVAYKIYSGTGYSDHLPIKCVIDM